MVWSKRLTEDGKFMRSTTQISPSFRFKIAIWRLARAVSAALLGDAHSLAARALDHAGLIRLRRIDSTPTPRPTDTDSALRIRLLERLHSQPSWHRDFCTVLVVDGTAVLQGLLGSSEDRLPVRFVAMSTPGIKAVRDDRVRAHA